MMSKTRELLIASFFFILGFLVVHNFAKAEDAKCYPNVEFMKFIDDQKLVTLYNGMMPDNKVQEILMSKDRRIFTVVYDKSTDNNAMGAKQYCVTSIVKDVTFNDSAIEFLSGLLEKYKGQKT